jgi:hypothetical protein
MVSQLDPTGHMRGLITTLNKQRASFVPVSTPIVYVKRDDFTDVTLGDLAAGHPGYHGCKQLLDETLEQGYARLLSV